jgi:hypothetical protein
MTYVYLLLCPETGNIRYVGKTVNPSTRLRDHHRDTKDLPHLHKSRWLKKLQGRGLSPEMEIVETCEDVDGSAREKVWIAAGRKAGWPLTNISEGGDGFQPGHIVSAETAAKISASNKGRKGRQPTPEEIEKLRRTRTGRKLSPDWRAAISKAMKGKKRVRVYSKRVRDMMTARNKSAEHIEKARAFHTGRKRSEETKKRISEARKGRKLSPEALQARRNKMRHSSSSTADANTASAKQRQFIGCPGISSSGGSSQEYS